MENARSAAPRSIDRGPAERVAAWLVTGPVGHLVAFLADLGVLLATLARAALRRALTGSAEPGG